MTSVIILGILAGIMYLSVLLIEKFINQKNHILLGWLVMKLSIMLLFASSSQIPKNVINIPI